VTFTVNERVMEKRTEDYYTRELVTKPETRTYTILERVETKKTGTRKVGKPVTVTETRKVKKDMGAYEERTVEVVCSSSSCGKRRLCGRRNCDSGCETYTTTCTKRVWVPKIVEVEEKVNVVKTEWSEEKYDYVEVSCKPVQKTETVNVTH